MPRCSCAGATCGCKIEAGAGIEVTGLGTAADPYIIAATIGSLDSVMTFVDSDTIDFTVVGDGIPGDPLVVSAATKRQNFPQFASGGAPDPATWGEGAFYYDTTDNTPKWSDGSSWAAPGAGGAGQGINVPVGAVVGPEATAYFGSSAQFTTTYQGVVPYEIPDTITVDALVVSVDVAQATTVYGALWKCVGRTIVPAGLVASASVSAATTGVKALTFSSPQVLTPGLYFAGVASAAVGALRMTGCHPVFNPTIGLVAPGVSRRWQIDSGGAAASPSSTISNIGASAADDTIWVGLRRSA